MPHIFELKCQQYKGKLQPTSWQVMVWQTPEHIFATSPPLVQALITHKAMHLWATLSAIGHNQWTK